MKLKTFSLFTLTSLICAGVILFAGYWVFVKGEGSHHSKKPRAVFVSMAKVGSTSWQPSVKAVGTLSAVQGITIKSEIAGRITKVFFDSGSTVKEETPLVQLNPAVYQAQLDVAKATYTLSKTVYKKEAKLYKTNVVSQVALAEIFAKVKSNHAQVQQAQAELNQTLIKTPFSGRLGLKLVSAGEYIKQGQPIVSLQNINNLYVNFSLPEIYLNQLKAGEPITITSSLVPNKTFNGTIHAFETVINAETRSLPIRGIIQNNDGKLLPGNFVDVTIYFGTPKKYITVPQTAINYSTQGNYVFTVDNGVAKKVVIKQGAQVGQNIIITKGLTSTDTVITAGGQKVSDGEKVTDASKQLKKGESKK